MAASVDRMDRLVQGLLGLARVDGDDREVERVDVGEMIGEIADPRRDRRGRARRRRQRRPRGAPGMLVNLIDNGRNHGGRVSVALRAERVGGRAAR